MKVTRQILLLACATLSLQGCGAYYHAPTTGDTAKVRFTSPSPSQRVMVTAYESEQCEIGKTGGIMGVVGIGIGGTAPTEAGNVGNTLGMMGYSEFGGTNALERLIPGGKTFTFSLFRIMSTGGAIEQCNLSLSFLPLAGREYQVDFHEDDNRCYANVFQLQQGSTGRVVKIRETSLGESEKDCSRATMR